MRGMLWAALLLIGAGCEEGDKLLDTGPVLADTGASTTSGTGEGSGGGGATGGAATGGGSGTAGGSGTGGAGTGGGGAGTGGGGTGTGGGTADCTPTATDSLRDLDDPPEDPDAVCGAGPLWDSVSGYASWFVGDFTVDGCGVVGGQETMHVVANRTWTASGGADCVVVFSVAGVTADERSLTAETEEWTLDLTLDARTTCGPEVTGGLGSGEVVYRVTLSPDGSTFAFTSGTVIGSGAWNANHATYRSAIGCTYL